MIETILGIVGLILWIWGVLIAFRGSIIIGIVTIFLPVLGWVWVLGWLILQRRFPDEIMEWWGSRGGK